MAEANSSEKIVNITGKAAEAMAGGGRRRRRATRKMRGGDNSGGLLQLAAQGAASGMEPMNPEQTAQAFQASVAEVTKQLPLYANATQKGGSSTGAIVNLASTRAPITPDAPKVNAVVSGQPVEDLGPAMSGGVVLKPAKKQVRVALRAPKKGGAEPQTRKAPRRIRLGVKGLKTRLNRAKKAQNHAQTTALPIIKQRLVRAGVIKASSKAPESMLRTMYADLLITKKGL